MSFLRSAMKDNKEKVNKFKRISYNEKGVTLEENKRRHSSFPISIERQEDIEIRCADMDPKERSDTIASTMGSFRRSCHGDHPIPSWKEVCKYTSNEDAAIMFLEWNSIIRPPKFCDSCSGPIQKKKKKNTTSSNMKGETCTGAERVLGRVLFSMVLFSQEQESRSQILFFLSTSGF